MKPEQVRSELGDVPHMSLEQGRTLWEFLVRNKLSDCLELGFFHGTSSAYIAGAIDEQGGGSLVSIDLAYTRTLEPNIEETLKRVGLRRYCTLFFEETSYVWRLMHFLQENPNPRFDFCYLDGAHTWFVDGFACLLVERLLRPGGWIVFDDLDWSYANNLSEQAMVGLSKQLPRALVESIRNMPEEERQTKQIRQIYELLVKPSPAFSEFKEDQQWAYARKRPNAANDVPTVRREIVTVPAESLTAWLRKGIRRRLNKKGNK